MADIRNLIAKKTAEAEARQTANKQEREELSELRSAALEAITGNSEMYHDFLNLQGSNLRCSVGNIALVLAQRPDATQVGDRNYWHDLGRFVKEEEMKESARVFIPPRNPHARGYYMGDYYDVSQTTGKPLMPSLQLEAGTAKLDTALSALMDSSPVTFQEDNTMESAAFYDPKEQVIFINPERSNEEIFAGLAIEIAHAKIHNRGRNEGYDRQELSLDAESAGYLLCKKFGVDCPLPNAGRVAQLYESYEPGDRENILGEIRKLAVDMSRKIERAVQPRTQEQKRSQNHKCQS